MSTKKTHCFVKTPKNVHKCTKACGTWVLSEFPDRSRRRPHNPVSIYYPNLSRLVQVWPPYPTLSQDILSKLILDYPNLRFLYRDTPSAKWGVHILHINFMLTYFTYICIFCYIALPKFHVEAPAASESKISRTWSGITGGTI